MASEQVKTVLDHTREYHSQAGGMFAKLASECSSPRASMLLTYLSRHEQELAAAIQRIEEDTSSKVLNTWVSSSEDTSHLSDVLEEGQPRESASFDEWVEWGLKTDDRALCVYEDLALRGEPAWLRDVFQHMFDMEQQEERRVAVQTLRGMDL